MSPSVLPICLPGFDNIITKVWMPASEVGKDRLAKCSIVGHDKLASLGLLIGFCLMMVMDTALG